MQTMVIKYGRSLSMSRGKLQVTTEMIRAARELLRWNQEDLAERAGIGVSTLRVYEVKPGKLTAPPETRARIIAALQGAGIEFLDNGVKLR
jgi:transcriptional regulator with XRE-family HTH domain